MRKLKIISIALLIIVLAMSLMACSTKTYNISASEEISLKDEAYDRLVLISSIYPNRTIGTTDSEQFTSYLNEELTSFGYSVEEQSFTSKDAKMTKNIIAKKNTSSDKGTILLGASWDNMYASFTSHPDGAYETGNALAALLTVAKYLYSKDLSYNLEIAFFAGDVENWSGAEYYLSKLSSEEKQNIKLYINYGYIAGGDNLYIYARDTKTEYENFVNQVGEVNNLTQFTKTPQFKNTFDVLLIENQLYSYSHIGMYGNHVLFMNEQIPSIAYLSINWSDYSYPIYKEVKGSDNICQSGNDNLTTVVSRKDVDTIKSQLDGVMKSTIYSIVDNQSELLNVLDNREEIVPFFQSTAAYYIFNVAAKILVVAIVLIIGAYAKSQISKSKDELLKKRIVIDPSQIDLNRIKERMENNESFDDIFNANKNNSSQKQNEEPKDNNDNIDDDDVFQ